MDEEVVCILSLLSITKQYNKHARRHFEMSLDVRITSLLLKPQNILNLCHVMALNLLTIDWTYLMLISNRQKREKST